MRFRSFFSIILFVLIFKNDINGESISFMNLIPSIIANHRFVQENIIDSTIEFNQTLPWINIDLTIDANGSNCSQDIQLLARDLATRKIWVLKTLDAWGKFPSGVMQGNIYWVGSVFECKHHLRGLNNSVVQQPFRTRTCTIGNGFSNIIRPVYGLCVPQSCNANDLVNYINTRTIRIPFIKRFIHLTDDNIHCIDHRSYDGKAILTIVILTILVILILLATGMHIACKEKYSLQVEDSIRSGYEPILDQTIVETETETVITTTTAATTDPLDEGTPLIARPRQTVDSIAQNLINCCSLTNNYQLLKNKSQPNTLACLNGIRVLSLCWVILGHTFVFAAFYSDNVVTIINWSRHLYAQIIIQAVFSIDSFFLLSGLLTAFIYFISKIENERFSILRFFVNHYIYRYLRYTIFYAIMLLIYITLSPYFGQSGPIYPINGSETLACKHTWWRNLLYINNMFDSRDSCMPVTWFLAANMQLHWIAPLFLLATSWKWICGILVAIVFIIVDIISTSVIMSTRGYDHGMFSDLYSNRTNTSHNYMNDVYIKPWCRITPYAIGLILGHILYEMHQRDNTLSWESLLPQRRLTGYKHIKQIIAWILALVIMALCIFGTHGDFNGNPLTSSERVAFHALSRLGWAIGLSIIIIICFINQRGKVNKFLSHSFFHLLAKLTFGAYLWHSLVLTVNYLGSDQPIHFTLPTMIFNFIIHTMISYILSFFTFLLFELPIIQLLKSAFHYQTNNSV
ncbi:unnamed protein product [Adineta steineri]|uniref:Nose resistant-to-fluoxetine protein N-terminal domain-containing protein n=1 Tax=Adineta steineri TaxID=433720 RepID=A0A818JR01_9BILA|nr:unnamed protein product [Adineta steineri]